MIDTYDQETCITAGELRWAGAPIDPSIPDCAWVPRSAVKMVPGDAPADPSNPGTIHVGVTIEFSEPWRWVSMTVNLPAPECPR